MNTYTVIVLQFFVGLGVPGKAHDASPGKIPYQLSLKDPFKHYCGAALTEVNGIQYALTSAYCLEKTYVKSYVASGFIELVGGFVDFSGYKQYSQSRTIKNFFIHESFNRDTMENDIALLLLHKPFRPSINISTITLPLPFQSTTGELTVSGWGRMFHGGPNPYHLQVTKVRIIDNAACKEAYPAANYSLFCSAALNGHNTYCNAETGSPVRASAGYPAGIASFLPTQICSDPNMPQVYVEVSRYVDWIKQKISAS